ncbi:PREDICTED: uncharacterized protein LOC101297965 [Fragaria vesca subsp. vesca]|uniref:uncharacterized protein LOC101297965 n=1 Tax=Fragaria vesca subsp. vesca TaxID=101020 RepID=UPI0002C32F12|nr:PREDICTED: uncharacterized protein LOC101297965 [Fragaria vesca subsp. vesca]
MGERNKNGKRPAVSERSPGFCLRIQSREDLKDGKKEIPPAAVRKYGDQIADHIFLKVPNCGTHWKIELRTSPRRDRMWLEKGWEELASFYLLDQGDSATFTAEGEDAHFRIRIFSWDDMEIYYPIRGGGADLSRPKRKETRAEVEAEAGAISVSAGSSADEHQNDISKVSSFRSDRPCLNVPITATSLTTRVFINSAFALEHFCKDGSCCDLTLQNTLGDTTWTVQCISYAISDGRMRTVLSGAGWKSFRQDNLLEEGDVLVLEVIEERRCRVSIIRVQK